MYKIFIITSLFFFNACAKKNNSQNQNETMTTNVTQIENQKTYGIEVNSPVPIIIYLDDIKISERNTPMNTVVDLNPYLLRNGNYNLKLVVNPLFRKNESLVKLEHLKSIKLKFGSYLRDKKTDNISNFHMDLNLPLYIPSDSVPYFVQEWKIDVKELPYKLEGWSNGQDLSKLDKKELEEKVLTFHEKVRKVLNTGNSEEWLKLTNKRLEEIKVFDYYDNDLLSNDISNIKLDVEKYAKNTMVPIEDYELKLYADGKLVTLERKNHTREYNNQDPLDLKGRSPLISKGKVSGAADYPILLYLPQNSDEFVIIRK